MSASRNKEIIQKVNAAFEQNNPEVFLNSCTDDIKWYMAGDNVRIGKDTIREFMASMGDMKLDELNVTAIIAEDDSAACYGEMKMTENGTPAAYSYCDVYRFAGDKIAELRSFVVKHKTEGESGKTASA